MPLVTSPDTEFLDQITKLEEAAATAADATLMTGQRKWFYPPLNAWSGDPYNITGMNSAFVRDSLNNTYKLIINDTTGAGSIGESMVIKLQVDYIAALERSFRTRHCSSVRARLHAAARRKGQGSATGVFTGSVVLWLERLLLAANDNPFMGVNPGERLND